MMAGAVKAGNVGLGRRIVFWDFARATWQYDLVVGLILVFIFATPRTWFHDQPKAASVTLIPSMHGSDNVFVAANLLADVPEANRPQRAQQLLHQHTGKNLRVLRVEPILDEAEHEVKGYIAYTAP